MPGAGRRAASCLHRPLTWVWSTGLLIGAVVLGRFVADLVAQGICGPNGEVRIAQRLAPEENHISLFGR